jgi:hypothetical protein
VAELLVGGLLEGVQGHPLGVDAAQHVTHDAALAGGVHALQDDEHRAPVPGARDGPEPFLEFGEQRHVGGELGPGLLLVPQEARGAAGVDVGEHEFRPDGQLVGRRVGVGERLDGPLDRATAHRGRLRRGLPAGPLLVLLHGFPGLGRLHIALRREVLGGGLRGLRGLRGLQGLRGLGVPALLAVVLAVLLALRHARILPVRS